jgi:hypothetical protein
VNVGDVKPKPRRRRPPAKKPAQPFAFGGGGGGSGLAQVVQAPQATQDVLQQSKELREIVNRLQTSPAQLTLRGAEQGGQAEQQIEIYDQPVTRGQFTNIMGQIIGRQGEQMALAGERLESVRQAIHALGRPPQAAESESDISITELHDLAHTPSSTLVEPAVSTPMRMGRGKSTNRRTESERPRRLGCIRSNTEGFCPATRYLVQHPSNDRKTTRRYQRLPKEQRYLNKEKETREGIRRE